jgi:hypothetical protein
VTLILVPFARIPAEGYFAKELRRENRKNSINKIFNN